VTEAGFTFESSGSRTSAVVYPAAGAASGPAQGASSRPAAGASGSRPAEGARSRATLILAHGAGAPQTHPWMVRMAGALASRGLDVVTFNFLYADARRRVPDKNAVLEATWLSAIDAVRARDDVGRGRLFIGGKSMGGRIATQVAAGATLDGLAGLVLLGYPLHPPGRPDKLRTAHLAQVQAPMLFVQGTRDAFGGPAELEPFVAPLAARGTRVFPVESGDHSLVPLKSTGLGLEQVVARVADEIARFTG
jgi:uncharacterized protein